MEFAELKILQLNPSWLQHS